MIDCVKFLKDNKITPTKQRVDIAMLIFHKNQHFTASDLITLATKSSLHISQATIYNTLCLFESRGILKTIDLQNDRKFYDTNLSLHHHIYNVSTKVLTDVSDEQIEFSKLPDLPDNLEFEKAEVLIKVKNKN